MSAPSETSETKSTEKITEAKYDYEIRESIEMNSFNSQFSIAKCTESDNAADFSSLLIESQQGDYITFENVNFDNAKCLLLAAAISEGSTSKTIELYIDEVNEQNKIGALITSAKAKANNFEFYEQYAELRDGINGVHNLIFFFPESAEFEADWFKLSSYNGTETEERTIRG